MSVMQRAMEFLDWVASLHSFPTPERVAERFEVSPATANRWLNDYADAKKVLRPYRKPGRRRETA